MDIDKATGMLVGLAIGDALGAPLEFQEPREPSDYLTEYTTGGEHNVSLGEWTDDTSMALAMAKSLLKKKCFDAKHIMASFLAWYKDGEHSPRGECFDIGGTTAIALQSYLQQKKIDKYLVQPYRGRTAKDSSGNGALMRLAPTIIVAKDRYHAIQLAVQQTLLTHGSNTCIDYSVMLAEELYHGYPIARYDRYKLPLDTPREEVMSGGYVKETYQCAWWAFQTTNSFEDCVVKAVNRGYDADTVGAVAGMIAGRYYGHSNIPSHFKDKLLWHDDLLRTAVDLCNMEYRDEH